IPPSFDSYSEIIFELANENQVDLMLEVWKRAAPLPGIMQPQIVAVAGAALVQSERGEDAAQFWREATQKLAHPIPEDTSGSVLWDGGFESGFTLGGLGWQYDAAIDSVQLALDKQVKRSGQASLRLMFTGRANINFRGVCHWTPVLP